MASSSTSESDSLPVSSAVQSTKVLWSKSRQQKNEGYINYPHYTPLCTAFGSGCTTKRIASYGPAHYFIPPPPPQCKYFYAQCVSGYPLSSTPLSWRNMLTASPEDKNHWFEAS